MDRVRQGGGFLLLALSSFDGKDRDILIPGPAEAFPPKALPEPCPWESREIRAPARLPPPSRRTSPPDKSGCRIDERSTAQRDPGRRVFAVRCDRQAITEAGTNRFREACRSHGQSASRRSRKKGAGGRQMGSGGNSFFILPIPVLAIAGVLIRLRGAITGK